MKYINFKPKYNFRMMHRLRFAVCCISLAFTFVLTSFDVSASGPTVYWGGVGFSGVWQDRNSLYPATSKLLNCVENEKCLDRLAVEKFAKRKFDKFNLKRDKIDRKEVEALVGVLSINSEFYGTHFELGSYEHKARILAQFLIYQIGSGKIIHNVPFIIYANSDSPTNTDKEKHNLAEKLIFSGDFFEEAYKKSKQLDPTNIPGKYSKINKFEFSKSALTSFLATEKSYLGRKFGQFFESELVGRTDAQFVPMTIGSNEAGNKIKMTFGDGERELSVPEAAFNVDVLIRKAALFGSTRGKQRTICPAVALTLNVSTEIDTVTNLKFAVWNQCGVVHVEQKLEMGYLYQRSLISLLQNMAKQFGMPDPSTKWLASNARGNDGKDVKAEIKKLNNTVFSLDF